MDQPPTDITLHQRSQVLEFAYSDEERYRLSAEFLRVHSPSAEVQGHGPGQRVLQTGKRDVRIEAIEPVGQYGIKLIFSDGHDTGIYTWKHLRELGSAMDSKWREYLQALEAAGAER